MKGTLHLKIYTTALGLLLNTIVSAQTYTVEILTNQTYTEITNADYAIPDSSIYFGNVTIRPNMSFKTYSSTYDLNEGVFTPLKQGYSYFINSNKSTTIYVAKGVFGARQGENQTSEFSFKTSGTTNNHIFVSQWKNMGFTNGNESSFINFQLKLYEQSGVIEMHFGVNQASTGLWENNANGPTIGLLEMNAAFSTIYNQIWLSGNALIPSIESGSQVYNLNSTPPQGTVYRFKPTPVGVKSNELIANVSIYPNPAQHELHINCQGVFTATVLTLSGKLCSQVNGNNTATLNLQELPNGIYLLQTQTQHGVSSQKIVHNN